MATKSCHDCNLREYLIYWLVTSGPSWLGLIIILIWAHRILSSPRPDQPNSAPNITRWLEPYLRSYRDVIPWIVLHCALLVTQLVEGYWILLMWWQCFTGYWNWKLKKSEWGAQLWQTLVLVLLVAFLAVLLVVGFLLLLFAFVSIIELSEWKPKGSVTKVETIVLKESHGAEEDMFA